LLYGCKHAPTTKEREFSMEWIVNLAGRTTPEGEGHYDNETLNNLADAKNYGNPDPFRMELAESLLNKIIPALTTEEIATLVLLVTMDDTNILENLLTPLQH